MMFDAQNLFSNKQAITTTAVSTNTIDLTVAQDLAPGEPIDYAALVTTTLAGGTSVQFDLIVSANADLSSPTVLQSSAPIVTAALTSGSQIPLRATIPVNPGTKQRYLGLRYTVVGTFTSGNITAGLLLEVQASDAYYKSGLLTAGV